MDADRRDIEICHAGLFGDPETEAPATPLQLRATGSALKLAVCYYGKFLQ
jgi:hypothetical protein